MTALPLAILPIFFTVKPAQKKQAASREALFALTAPVLLLLGLANLYAAWKLSNERPREPDGGDAIVDSQGPGSQDGPEQEAGGNGEPPCPKGKVHPPCCGGHYGVLTYEQGTYFSLNADYTMELYLEQPSEPVWIESTRETLSGSDADSNRTRLCFHFSQEDSDTRQKLPGANTPGSFQI